MQERNRPTAVHEKLLQNENHDTLLAVGEECYRLCLLSAKKWGWADQTPDPDGTLEVTEIRHVSPLFRKRSIVPAASHANLFGSAEVSLQYLGNRWKQGSHSLEKEAEALFCRRATEMGVLFDTFRIQRNRLHHDRGDIGLEDAGVLASSVLLLVKLAGGDLVEPERLEPLSVCSRHMLRSLHSNGAPFGDPVEGSAADEPDEGTVPKSDYEEVLERIERDQQSLLAQVDRLPTAVCKLMEERRVADAASDPGSDAPDDAPVSVTSVSRRRTALLQLRDRISREKKGIKAWENICQRPIVDALLAREKDGRAIRERSDLYDVPAFRLKYDRHSGIMEPLMEAYGKEMLHILAGDAPLTVPVRVENEITEDDIPF